jgi:single-stranded-DNA-specific exonuclease
VARELRRRGHYAKGTTEPSLLADLDLVALATVADVVPLIGLNRAFVAKGLAVMRRRENTGLRALADAAGLNQVPTTYHLGYILGPRINAGGRIGDAGLGARLLSTADETDAARIAALLERLNKERKAIEQASLEEALAEADRIVEADANAPFVIVGSETWHKGVIGLVASRLTECFRRPSCVISWEKDGASASFLGTGSLRSIGGVDIGAAVRRAVAAGHLVKGGGHAMAAGLTVRRERFDSLQAFFISELRDASRTARTSATLPIDGALTPSAVSGGLLDLLERAGPYGQGNPMPRFAFPAHRVKFAKVMGKAHVRCVLEASDASRLDAGSARTVCRFTLREISAATPGAAAIASS